MKFDFIIGNPPYQENRDNTKDMPVYHQFIDSSYLIAEKIELITPARFLFNAGATPKKWNQKMLSDTHFKILDYEPNSANVFSNTDIKGGVVITYHDISKSYNPIEIFTAYPELKIIVDKVRHHQTFSSINSIMFSPANCQFTKEFIANEKDAVRLLSDGNEHMLATNIFETLNDNIFNKNIPNGEEEKYLKIYGRYNNERVYRWIDKKYVRGNNIDNWKIVLPKTSGTGEFGEVLSSPYIIEPISGHTQSFISIGQFNTKDEANSALKYIKTKFARALLGVLKVTQDCPPEKWKYVPNQDFTKNSDIDWSKPISEIDKQLYTKYNLLSEDIDFIEMNIKEMV